MTIIVCKDGVMAADSCETIGGRIDPAGYPKIWRAPDGALCAGTGESGDCYAFGQWFVHGRLHDEPEPMPTQGGGDEPQFLILEPGGELYRKTGTGRMFPVNPPYALGESASVNFCMGAMAARCSAEEAVTLAVGRYIWIGGPVQVERLRP